MDLRLKEDAKKGYFGRASGGLDFSNFYEGEFLFNKFNKDFKLSVFFSIQHPRANFGYGDIKKYGLSTDNGNFLVTIIEDGGEDQMDITTMEFLKLSKLEYFFSDKVGEKVKIGFNYTYNQSSLDARSDRNLQYQLRDTTFMSKKKFF